MTRLLLVLGLLMAVSAPARSQPSPNEISITTFDPDNAIAPVSVVEGPGWKVGEGTVVHPVIGLETGLVSNVFYTADNPQAAGVLRLLAQIGTGTYSGDRLVPAEPTANGVNEGSLQYRASVRASYDQIISGNSTANGTSGLGLGATLRGMANPMGKLSLGFSEDFSRLIRAANFETNANTNRDINVLGLQLLFHPPERSVSGYLYFNDTIDVFEKNSQQFADRIDNRLGVHPSWRWLPQTTIFADISEGVTTGLGSSSGKVTSYPFVALLGIATLLTPSTTLNVQGGYTNGFYSKGPSYSAFTGGAAFGYRYSPFGRVTLSYDLAYQDSINANYYRDHTVRALFQQLAAPFVLMAGPEVHFRHYDGITIVPGPMTRDDTIFAVVAGIHYILRNSFAITADYRFSTVQTNYRYTAAGMTTDPSYVRHELLAGVRWAM